MFSGQLYIFGKKVNKKEREVSLIKDNLARKNVDLRTIVTCHEELKKLRGLKRGELGKVQRKKGKSGFSSVNPSAEGFMTDAEISKKTGISEATYSRAKRNICQFFLSVDQLEIDPLLRIATVGLLPLLV